MVDMSNTQNTAQDPFEGIIKVYDGRAEDYTEIALGAIAKAKRDLEHIEAQLRLAKSGQPYHRVGEMSLPAQDVFNAFGAIETAATLRNVAKRKQESA